MQSFFIQIRKDGKVRVKKKRNEIKGICDCEIKGICCIGNFHFLVER